MADRKSPRHCHKPLVGASYGGQVGTPFAAGRKSANALEQDRLTWNRSGDSMSDVNLALYSKFRVRFTFFMEAKCFHEERSHSRKLYEGQRNRCQSKVRADAH